MDVAAKNAVRRGLSIPQPVTPPGASLVSSQQAKFGATSPGRG